MRLYRSIFIQAETAQLNSTHARELVANARIPRTSNAM